MAAAPRKTAGAECSVGGLFVLVLVVCAASFVDAGISPIDSDRTTHAAATIHPAPVPAGAVNAPTAWLRNYTAEVLRTCTITAADGTTMFTPDGTHQYNAQWTRDFAYMLMYAGDILLAEYSPAVVRRSVDATMKGQRADGCFPDRVQADGIAVYSPGPVASQFADHAIDNNLFAVLLVDAYTAHTKDYGYFVEVKGRLDLGLAFVNVTAEDGLVFNSETSPNCTYGFTDTVKKTGRLAFCSVLLRQALVAMARMTAAAGLGGGGAYTARASTVAASLRSGPLYDETSGMLFAADRTCRQVDVWGSALAAHEGMLTKVQAGRVAKYLGGTMGLYQHGQVRHLPPGEYWEACFTGNCPQHGTYQNGAYWATPLAWVVPFLRDNGYGPLASTLVADTLRNFQSKGVMEAINDDIPYTGVPAYVASATNVWSAVRG